MDITTSPNSRFLWDGATVRYVVKAEGATELKLAGEGLKGVEARLTGVRRTGAGVEGVVEVSSARGTFA